MGKTHTPGRGPWDQAGGGVAGGVVDSLRQSPPHLHSSGCARGADLGDGHVGTNAETESGESQGSLEPPPAGSPTWPPNLAPSSYPYVGIRSAFALQPSRVLALEGQWRT